MMEAKDALKAIRSACYQAFRNGYGYAHHSTVEGYFEDDPEAIWNDIWDEDAQAFIDELVDCPEIYHPIDALMRDAATPEAPNPEVTSGSNAPSGAAPSLGAD